MSVAVVVSEVDPGVRRTMATQRFWSSLTASNRPSTWRPKPNRLLSNLVPPTL
jgi:hypothetical protein